MKFSAATSLLLALAGAKATLGDNRGLASLAEQWSISDPTVDISGLSFTFDYPVSNFIDQGQAYYQVYDKNCKEGGTSVSTGFTFTTLQDVEAGSVTDDETFDAQGKSAGVPIAINPATIASDTAVYTETNTAGEIGAEIVFCVRFGLNTPGDSPIEVNFLESIVTLTVDLSSGFDVNDVNVEPKDQLINTADQAYGVEAYMCEPGSDTAVADADAALSQGSLITICVKPTPEAIADGIKMRTIDSFSWERDTQTQEAITSGVAASNLLTSFDEADCAGADYCQFSSILFAAFYATAGQVSGSGVSSVQFGGRRHLRESNDSRALQAADGAAGTSEFDMSVNILGANDGPGALRTAGGAASTTMIAGVMALLGAIAMV